MGVYCGKIIGEREEMKIKELLKKNWNYIIAFLLPWILVVIHSIVRDSWLTGNGSILSGEAGTVYYGLYVELWDKVHQGGSLFFSWNAGMGTDYLVNLFQYLISPFTLLVLVIPRSGIANMLQFIMVLKWSLAAVTMTGFFMHTKHNRIEKHKRFMSLVLAACFFFGNVVIQSLSNVSWGDILILFPLALLLEEKMAEGRGFKRFYACLAAMLLCNFRLAVPVLIFLVLWYILQFDTQTRADKKNIWRFVYCVLAALLTGMAVILPCAAMGSGMAYGEESAAAFVKSLLVSGTDFIQRLFVCDSLNFAQSGQPMLYISVAAVAVALLYVFIPAGKRQKGICILLLILLIAGLTSGAGSLLWHGYIGMSVNHADIAFLLSFLMVYMAMTVLADLQKLKIWNVLVVLAVGIAAMLYAFFRIQVYLDFYVYLATFLLYFFILLLLVFYCRKSIKYHNMLIVFSVFCIGELAVNAYMQMDAHNMYPVESSYYNGQSEVLAGTVEPEKGERLANTQTTVNYGMVLNQPSASAQLVAADTALQNMYRRLGMKVSSQYYEYFGGSPLLNTVCNIRYGMSQDAVAFSDVEKKGENKGYSLYEMKRLAGLGYMVNKEVTGWDLDQLSPFEAQNNFVRCATGEEGIFETVTPELTCTSLLGGERLEEELTHDHEEGEVHVQEETNPVTVVEFDTKQQNYHYFYEKMYSADVVTASFEADGVTDYYVFLKSAEDVYSTVVVGDTAIYEDAVASQQETFHIGVVEKGETISIVTNAVTDDLSYNTLSYQIAAFKEENYARVYDILSANCYRIDTYADNRITGTIEAGTDGIMMTSVPAAKGWKVYVDDKLTEYENIGGALIGIPLTEGEHKVEFRYATPYSGTGGVLALVGIFLFAGYCVWEKKQKPSEEDT